MVHSSSLLVGLGPVYPSTFWGCRRDGRGSLQSPNQKDGTAGIPFSVILRSRHSLEGWAREIVPLSVHAVCFLRAFVLRTSLVLGSAYRSSQPGSWPAPPVNFLGPQKGRQNRPTDGRVGFPHAPAEQVDPPNQKDNPLWVARYLVPTMGDL